MSTLIPELEHELERAIGRRIAEGRARGPLEAGGRVQERAPRHRHRQRRRARRSRRAVLLLAALLLLVAATALAAGGVIPIGAPVSDPPGAPEARPDVGTGTVVPGSVKLLPLRVADPRGGPPWGLRLTGTTRGLGCLYVGRVVDGQLGALGRDGAFHDDGRFHPFPGDLQMMGGCRTLDDARHLFVAGRFGALPAAAVFDGSCLLDRSCPRDTLRQVSFGALGPHARSLTYVDRGGKPHTVAVHPPYGEYLLLLPPDGLDFGVAGGSAVPSAPITAVAYEDGTCRFPLRENPPPCPFTGERRAPSTVTAADVRAPVRARVEGGHVVIRFRARVAVTGAGSHYEISRHLRGARTGGLGVTQRDLRAGETYTQTFYGPPHRGLYTGTVSYVPAEGFGGPKLVVGTYRLRVP
jgi:hypothetical protein